MQPPIFTIGHGTRTIGEFLGLLKAAGVRRLVDVRRVPVSRRHPQFIKEALAARLRASGIRYVWREDLGGWRTPRSDSRHLALTAFRGYADYMESAGFQAASEWLLRTSAKTPTAVMCAESLWWKCHRQLIADALTVRGARVLHILAGGRIAPHRLHPTARRRGHMLIYDRRTIRNV